MALPNDSLLVTPGSGATIATHLVSSKEYQVMMQADPDGHIQGSAPSYILVQQPRVTTAAATDFFDLFNATGSGKIVRLRGVWPILEVTAASAIIPTFRFDLFRTSAVGTGGTPHTFESASAPAAGALQIARLSTVDAGTLPAQITSRSLPTGGATAAAWLFCMHLTSEETNAGIVTAQSVNWLPQLPYNPPFELQENQGFKIRQITATASTGTNFGWIVAFAVIP